MRELQFRVEVEQREAVADLAQVDRGFERVDASAKRAGDAIDRTISKTSEYTRELNRAATTAERNLDRLIEKQNRERDALATTHARQAARERAEVERQARDTDASLVALGRRVAAVFAVDSLARFASQAVAAADRVKALSDRTGLSVGVIQQFDYAAQRSGTTIETVSAAIGAMSKNILDGNSGAVAAFQKLGLAHDTLRAMRPEQAFLAIADAIREIDDPMMRTTLRQKIFGEQGEQIATLIQRDVRAMAQEYRELGAVLDDDVIAALRDAGQAWATFQKQGEAAFSTILARAVQTYQWIRDNGPRGAAWAIGETLAPTHASATGGVSWLPDAAFYRTAGVSGPMGLAANLGMLMSAVAAMRATPGESAERWLRGNFNFGPNALDALRRGMDDTSLRAIALQGLGPSLELPESAADRRRREADALARLARLDDLTGRSLLSAARTSLADVLGRGGVGVTALTNESALKLYEQFVDAKALAPRLAPGMVGVLDAALGHLEANPAVLRRVTQDVGKKLIEGIFDRNVLRAGIIVGADTMAEEVSRLLPLLMGSSPVVRQSVIDAGEGMIARAVDPNNRTTSPRSWAGLYGADALKALYGPFTPKPRQPGFWDSRAGQAAGVGIGIAGTAAIGAMAGGDQYASMIGSGAAAVSGVMLAGSISSTVALGAATMGIGAAAVGVYMLVKHFASVSKEVKQARLEVDEFQQSLWQTMTAQQVNEAAGEKWAATTIVVRDAFLRMGHSAMEAEMLVAQLLNTDKPDAAREAMARINDVVSEYRAILAGVNEQMGDLLGQAATLGQRLPQALLDSLDAAVKLGDMTKENARLIAKLSKAPEVDYEAFEKAAGRYGINPDALGIGFKQHKTTTTAQQMIDDLDLLHRGGASMGTILHGMREEISALVNDSLKFGTELPANMQPWINELFNTKQLVGENGEALTDITQLKFGESLQTTFQNVAKSIQELIDTLKGPLTRELDTIGEKVVTPTIEYQVRGGGDGLYPLWQERPEPERVPFANGGVVYASNGWPQPMGTDTVPAMLTPGEGVLSRRGMAALGRLNGDGFSQDGGMNEQRFARTVARELAQEMKRAGLGTVTLDGRLLTREVVERVGPAMRSAGVQRMQRARG